jgi:glycosyltransferase involved in cell wall biosynthesis
VTPALRTTVLIPTHDHGSIVGVAIESALRQTVRDLEVLVVGDGAPRETAETVERLARRDERVRYHAFPKGPRHGEVHRHRVLAEARGEIVCYLSDDDLWFPDHVEAMLQSLRKADFASAGVIRVAADGELRAPLIDLADPDDRAWTLGFQNRIPLSAMAHTIEAYRRIEGWTTTPQPMHTDRNLMNKFLASSWVRARTDQRITVLHLPTRDRDDVDREQELRGWLERLHDDRWRTEELPWIRMAALEGELRHTDDLLRRKWRSLAQLQARAPLRAWIGVRRARARVGERSRDFRDRWRRGRPGAV